MSELTEIKIDLGERSYAIQIGKDWLGAMASAFRRVSPTPRFVVITNPTVGGFWAGPLTDALAAAGASVETFMIPDGEDHKTLGVVSSIYNFLLERKCDRKTTMVALGGGVVGDVAGFAAATFQRGVNFLQAPTSLLAMVDSSVGGKTGVNHPLGKNMIGAFKQPAMVGIDLAFLNTLTDEQLREGMAEVVKYGMIEDGAFFEFLEADHAKVFDRDEATLRRIIGRSCEIKAEVVMEDELDLGRRAILNFGHTFGHAVETLSHYGVSHGRAVAIGMVAACRLGTALGCFDAGSTARLIALLTALGLPVRMPEFEPRAYVDVMKSDKKTVSGKMNFVVPTAIGGTALRDDVEEKMVLEVLRKSMEA